MQRISIQFVKKEYVVISLLILNFVIKIILALVLTVHGDEGMYLYDASLIGKGLTPHLDYHSRSPVYLYLLSVFFALFGKSVFVGRLCSIIASTITGIFVYKIGELMYDKKVGLISLILFSFSPFTLMWSVMIVTEVIQLMLVTISFYFILNVLKTNKSSTWFFLGGFLVGLSIFIRRTSAIVFFIEIALVFLYYKLHPSDDSANVIKKSAIPSLLLMLGAITAILPIFLLIAIGKDPNYAFSSFLSSAGWGSLGKGDKFAVFQNIVEHAYYVLILIFVYIVLSLKGVFDHFTNKSMVSETSIFVFFALGLFSLMVLHDFLLLMALYLFAFLLISWKQLSPVIPKSVKAHLEQSMTKNPLQTVVFIGLIILAIIGIFRSRVTPADVQSLLFVFISFFVLFLIYFRTRIGRSNKERVLLLPGSVFFIIYYLNSGFKDIGLVIVISTTILLLFYFLVEESEIFSHYPLFSNISILLWFSGIFVFYFYYSMSQEIFYYEMSSASCIMGGVVLKELHKFKEKRKTLTRLFFIFIVISLVTSSFYYVEEEQNTTIKKPWTIYEVSEYIKGHTNKNEEIFTANMAIAIEADRPIVMNLSHPAIYCKDYVQGFPDFDVIDYPSLEEIINYLDEHKVRIIVNDPLTNYYYFKYNRNLREYVEKNYIEVKEINHVKILERSKEGNYRLSSSFTDAAKPFVCQGFNNSIVVGYRDGKTGHQKLYYSTIRQDKNSLKDFPITPVTETFSDEPQGFIDNEGSLYLIWSEHGLTYSNILFSKFDKNGTRIIGPVELTSSFEIESYAGQPHIMLDSENHVHVVWSWRPEDEGYYNLYYAVLDKDGKRLTENIRLTNGPANNVNPSFAIDQEDNLHLVWQDGKDGVYQIFYKKFDLESNLTPPTMLVDSLKISSIDPIFEQREEATHPDISVNGKKVHITWVNAKEGYGESLTSIRYLQMDLNGTITIPETPMTVKYPSKIHEEKNMKTDVRNPTIATGNAMTVIVWQDNRWEEISDLVFWNTHEGRTDYSNRHWNIYYKVLDERGNVLVNDSRVSYYESNSITPDVVITENSIHIVWADDLPKNNEILHKEIELPFE